MYSYSIYEMTDGFAWESVITRLQWIYHGRPASPGTCIQTESPFFSHWCVTRGSLALRYGDRILHVRANESCFIPPGLRKLDFDENLRMLSIGFSLDGPNQIPFPPPPGGWQPVLSGKADRSDPLHRAAVALHASIHGKTVPSRYRYPVLKTLRFDAEGYFQFRTIYTNWIATLIGRLAVRGVELRFPPVVDSVVDAVCKRLAAGDRAGPLDPILKKAIAQATGLGWRRIEQRFRSVTGTSIKQYREQRLRARAMALCLESDLPGKVIAYQLGFKNPAQFSTWFVRNVGIAPMALRKRPPG